MNVVSMEKECASLHAVLAAFVYREAMLLDTGSYDEWLALYAESGLYWMPLSPDQRPGDEAPSLLYEDLLLLRLRIQRYANPRAHSLHPAVRGLRILQAPQVLESDPSKGLYYTRTPFLYVETQGNAQKMLAATAYHTIEGGPSDLRLRMKKVHLLNPDASIPAIQLLL